MNRPRVSLPGIDQATLEGSLPTIVASIDGELETLREVRFEDEDDFEAALSRLVSATVLAGARVGFGEFVAQLMEHGGRRRLPGRSGRMTCAPTVCGRTVARTTNVGRHRANGPPRGSQSACTRGSGGKAIPASRPLDRQEGQMATICDYCGKSCGRYHVSVSFHGLAGDDSRINTGHIHFHTQSGTAPGQAAMSCHQAALDLWFDRDEIEPTWESGELRRRKTPAAPKPLPKPAPERTHLRVVDRERVLLELLGDKRLTVRELSQQAWEAGWRVSDPLVRAALVDLVAAGQVERRAEPRGRTGKAVRYRYHVKTQLDGEIAELDRQFREGEAA